MVKEEHRVPCLHIISWYISELLHLTPSVGQREHVLSVDVYVGIILPLYFSSPFLTLQRQEAPWY